MRISLWLRCGALMSAILWPTVLARPILAQPAEKSGYDLLLAAAALIEPGDRANNGTPSTLDPNLAPAENLRRQRLAVSRNAPALALLRQALQRRVEVPLDRRLTEPGFPPQGLFREMARQLLQESDVRLAAGDAAGALDSRLTIIGFGAATTRGGPLIDFLVGASIEEMGRRNFGPIAAQLDAKQLRGALGRLQAIDGGRTTFAAILEAEKQLILRRTSEDLRALAAANAQQNRPGARLESARTDQSITELQTVMALPPGEVERQISQVFDGLITRAALPFLLAKGVAVPPAPNEWIGDSIGVRSEDRTRFNFERNLAAQRLFEAALELRAIKLESGAYPPSFNAPIDPFSNSKPLIYRRDAQNYRLYSIGPDGVDNDGAALETMLPTTATGAQARSYLSFDSSGDILAPVF